MGTNRFACRNQSRDDRTLLRDRGGDYIWRHQRLPVRYDRPVLYAALNIAGTRLCRGWITERLALALFPLNNHEADLGFVAADGLPVMVGSPAIKKSNTA